MIRAKLTNGAVERFQCREGRDQDVLWCGETRGFGMRLSTRSGARTYFVQFRVKGSKQERQITIGRHNDPWKVDQARAKALELKAQMLGGVDPVEEAKRKEAERIEREQREVAQSTTLRQVMEHYLEHRRTRHGPLRPATKKDIRRHCEKNLTSWLDRPVAAITRNDCLAKFTELSERAPVQANACLVYLRALLSHAREMHATEDGDYPILASNPVTRLFKLKKPNPEKARTTRIPLNKVGACYSWLRKRSAEARTETDRTAADWLTLILMTGCRRNEAGAIKKTDVHVEAKTIRLHADIVKNHNGIDLPIAGVLRDMLAARMDATPSDKILRRRRVQRNAEYLFASNGRKTPYIVQAESALAELSRICGQHVHAHALRRTLEDVAVECRIDSDVRRMLLNHINGDVHARHYSNGTHALAEAVETIAKWIVNQAAIHDAQASGTNVVNLFAGKTAN